MILVLQGDLATGIFMALGEMSFDRFLWLFLCGGEEGLMNAMLALLVGLQEGFLSSLVPFSLFLSLYTATSSLYTADAQKLYFL